MATDYLATRRAALAFGEPDADLEDCVLAALWCATRNAAPGALWSGSTGWRLGALAVTRWRFGARTVLIEARAGDEYLARSGAEEFAVALVARDETHSRPR